jgi:transcriptional regulator with XRE-family HTH domain
MNDEFENKDYRDAFVEENIRSGMAFQIRALRKRQQLSQGELGDRAGMPQNVISRLEDPEYGKFTINTLLALASAFDVALSVRFVSFSYLLSCLGDLSPEALAVPAFTEEAYERRTVESSLSDLLQPYISTNPSQGIDLLSWQTEPAIGALSALVGKGQRVPTLSEKSV